MGVVHRKLNAKPFQWGNIEIGEEYGPVEGTISDFLVRSHAYAVDDFGDWYLRDSPFGGRIAHSGLFANEILKLFFLGYDLEGPFEAGLHARNELELIRPVLVGQDVIIRGRNVEKYEKRDQRFRRVDGEVVDANGQVLVRSSAVETVGVPVASKVGKGTSVPRPDAITGDVPAGAPTVTRASAEVPVGAVLPTLTKHTTLEQSIIFSGFPFGWVDGGALTMRRSLHTMPEVARGLGQPDVVVQGLLSNSYFCQMCTEFFGESWYTTGKISVNFIRPVIARDTLAACGIVKSKEEDGKRVRIGLDVWCKNQRGELVTVGRASAEAS